MKQLAYISTQYLEMSVNLHAPSFYPLSTHYIGGCVGPRAVLDALEKDNVLFPGIELQFVGHLICSLVSTGITD